jgi:WD40 repeat protein
MRRAMLVLLVFAVAAATATATASRLTTRKPVCGAYGNVPHDRAPLVSRDGTTLAYTREFPRGGTRALVAAADGSRPHRVGLRGSVIALAPNGSEALLLEEGSAGDRYFLGDRRTGAARALTTDEVRQTRRRWRTPEWSPDGRFYVAVDQSDPYRAELWLFNAEGHPDRMIYRPAENYSQLFGPAWSPDGKTIAFLARPEGGDEFATAVWVVRPDGTAVSQVTNTYDSYGLKWSPDGRWLAFAEGPSKEPSRIAVVHADGSGFRWLTRTHYVLGVAGGQSTASPSWLDTRHIAFEARQWTYTSTANRVVVIHSIGLDGKGERRLTYHCHLGLRGRENSYYASHLSDLVRTFGGNDLVHAGPGDDDVDPGPGADRVFAGPGHDVVRARDSARDHVSCGTGRDHVFADRRDRIAQDCERVVRQ